MRPKRIVPLPKSLFLYQKDCSSTKKFVPLPKRLFLYQKDRSSTKKLFIPKAQLTLSANLPLFFTKIMIFSLFLGHGEQKINKRDSTMRKHPSYGSIRKDL